MRINLDVRTPDIAEQPLSENTRAGAKSAGAQSPTGDQAQVVNSTRVATLAAQVAQAPELREARVNALARSIRAGTYRVSDDQVAESIYSEMVARGSATH
jgi:anti-sigma28 factor (negative regulator of flagellin synthesis)